MPCKYKIPKGLGEAIENTGGKTTLTKEKPVTISSSQKPRGGAIKVPTYKS